MDLYSAIQEFHTKFGLDSPPKPSLLSDELFNFRIQFMLEEISEYVDASMVEDLEMQLDALVDLVYVALGTAYLHGFDFNEAFRRVHLANLKKIRAVRDSDSKRGSIYDVVKPEGWEPPDLYDLVHPDALSDFRDGGARRLRKNDPGKDSPDQAEREISPLHVPLQRTDEAVSLGDAETRPQVGSNTTCGD